MQFIEILRRCKGEDVIINNNEQRLLVDVCDDFLVLQGGNPQMRITEFVPVSMVVKLIRADYAAGQSNLSIDIIASTGDQRRSADH
jgi:hypothetical protein